ncbi:predicted protein [Pyrenophora tritici-repentis Pt-1C-BFP]|uniref:Uncharacterized protein n=1 Tax=Pyrenophora tritici-repentis (strain Pt-1C-BFP) TaxID=426418 RepID=B2W3X8_PYRTR|nr:uncharacterized protein PTRG_05178 [Pyrenophora tritici-repentis Pt-1C-BFP]EDU48085.1 predicted protein [Pyrenophora tritici-repentis Pt-1C-BFP]
MESSKGIPWTSVGLFHRGTVETREQWPVTILIGSGQADDEYWATVGRREIERLSKNRFQTEVVYSKDWRLTGSGAIDMTVHAPDLEMGASFGPAGLKGGATLGGFIKFVPEGQQEPLNLAITNHHVAIPSCSDIAVMDNRRSVTADSLPPGLAMPRFTSPTEDDHHEPEKSLRADKDAFEYLLEHLEAHLDRLVEGTREETATSTLKNTVKRVFDLKAALLSKEEEIDLVAKHTLQVGTALATSGHRLHIAPIDYQILDTRREYQVAFRGRTSGWEFGEVNSTVSILNAFTDSTPSEIPGAISRKYAVTPEEPGYSWAITPRWGYVAREPCRPGDSGSVVLLDPTDVAMEAKWVGLLFGHEQDSVAYMTPIDMVIQDMEMVLKGKIVSPVRVEL